MESDDFSMDASVLQQRQLNLRNSIISKAKDAHIFSRKVAGNRILTEASEAYNVILNEPKLTADIDGEPAEMFKKGKIAQVLFETHHAPHYVMMLDNGCLVRMVAHVESATENKPIGTSMEAFKENYNAGHTTVNWLDKSKTPFGATEK